MIEKGFYPTLSNESYHADPAISRSGIMRFHESPFKYMKEKQHPERRKSTAQMGLGSAFHIFVLEPERFHLYYEIEPKRIYLKYDGQQAYDLYKKQIADLEKSKKCILSNEEMLAIQEMRNSLLDNSEAMALLKDATIESSFFWQDKESGLMVKARPDILHKNIIVDLKTCSDASTRAYQREMYQYGYHVQGAIIREGNNEVNGYDIPNIINICVETKWPHEVGIKIISESALSEGRRFYKEKLLKMKDCIVSKIWSSYEPETVELASWMI